MYEVELKVNGETFTKTTNDLKRSILSLKPDFIHTEGYWKISKGEQVFERKLDLVTMRKLFADETRLDIFINNLMF